MACQGQDKLRKSMVGVLREERVMTVWKTCLQDKAKAAMWTSCELWPQLYLTC